MKLSVNAEEKYQYQQESDTSLQTASEFIQYLPVRR
jgi:hypothetical protein